MDAREQRRLVQALADALRAASAPGRAPSAPGGPADAVQVIETHISYVLLAGPYAYKIKKAIRLDFLDFSTLDARRFYCERELALNRRFAPALYLDVVPITGAIETPAVGAEGPAIEYALRMRRFSEDLVLSRVLARGELTPAHIDELAEQVAAFHRDAEPVPADLPFGTASEVGALALENFAELEALLDPAGCAGLSILEQWTRDQHRRLAGRFDARRRDGFVRACHGDLHLGNIAIVDGRVTLFDGIEFNERMRWGDVMGDVAFLVMDLEDRGRTDYAARALNRYLERTGDYSGVRLLPFYLTYRALVRAKVAQVRAVEQNGPAARRGSDPDYRSYLELAAGYTRPRRTAIIITHGFSGSGKTTMTEELVEIVRGIRIRTDVERKRLAGLEASCRRTSAVESGLYAPERTRAVYERVCDLAREIVQAGFPVIADGAFLKRWQRDLLRRAAVDLGAAFAIVDFTAPVEVLRARISAREQHGHDASDATVDVLAHQLASAEALGPDEEAVTVRVDTTDGAERGRDATRWANLLARLG